MSDSDSRFLSLLRFDPQAPVTFTAAQFLFWFVVFYAGYLALHSLRPRLERWSSSRGQGAQRGTAGLGQRSAGSVYLTLRLVYLTGFSWFLYYKASGWCVLALLATTLADFWVAQRMAGCPSQSRRRWWLAVSLSVSAGLLVYFKYSNFLFGDLWQLLGGQGQPFDVVLPAGISFYTFQSMSYAADVYRGKLRPTRSLFEYACYLAFFPQIMAGPIVRAEVLLDNLRRPLPLSAQRVGSGLFLILLGLVKKAVVADYLAQFVDVAFAARGVGSWEVMLGVYGYAAQIYCDFSGYSDMAVGLGRLTGIELPDNFRTPYLARSVSEFWRRWHITLSSWIRDYVYIPLGGSRGGRLRHCANLLVTMTLCGLWHGAGTRFIVWGALHGLLLVVESLTRQQRERLLSTRWGRGVSWLVTFHLVVLLWIPFRAPNWRAAMDVVNRVIAAEGASLVAVLAARADVAWAVLLGFALSIVPSSWFARLGVAFARAPLWLRASATLAVCQLVLQLRGAEVVPFIYFQF